MAAIAQWYRLRLPSCGPGFESQAIHLCFFQFVLLKLYRENNENKQKEARIGPFFKKINPLKRLIKFCQIGENFAKSGHAGIVVVKEKSARLVKFLNILLVPDL